MAAELPRPGVEVIQEFRTVSPSVVTPTLVPCVVGACKQIVEVLNGAALNADAKVSLAAFFVSKNAVLSGSRYVYTGLNGKTLYLAINNSPEVPVLFAAAYLTPAAVVAAINTALNDVGIYGVVAETLPETINGVLVERTWTLRTLATGDLESVIVGTTTDLEVWTAFDLKPGWVYAGTEMYNGDWMSVPPVCFPDPRNNLAELALDTDTLRVFFASSATNMRELQRKQAFCRRGSTIYAYDDGNNDALTPFVDVPGENFSSVATGAHVHGANLLTPAVDVVTGSVDTTSVGLYAPGGTLATTTLILNGVTCTFGVVNDQAGLLSALDAAYPADLIFSADAVTKFLVVTRTSGRIVVGAGSANALLGLVAGSTVATLTGQTLSLECNKIGQTYTFRDDTSYPITDTASILHQLNDYFTDFVFTAPADKLVITAVDLGQDSTVTYGGTALHYLGLTAQHVGTVDITGLSFPAGMHTPDQTVILDGVTYTPAGGQPETYADLLAELSATFGTDYSFTLSATDHLVIAKTAGLGSLVIGAGVANTVLGLTPGTYTCAAQTNGVAFPVYSGDELFIDGRSAGLINQVASGGVTTRMRLAKQVAMSTPASTTGTVDLVGVTMPTAFHSTDKTLILDGVTYTFTAGVPADEAGLLTALAAAFPTFVFSIVEVGAVHKLKITKVGSGPFVLGAGTANAVVGVTAGTFHPVLGTNFYIMARGLTGVATRPTPELQIGTGPLLAPNLLRDTAGVPMTTSKASVYLMYKALRKDVSTATSKPGLLKFSSQSDLLDALSPLDTDNPLGLGLYFALLNAPGAEVTGLGVDEISADMLDGTVEAFTRAAEFLEGVEVYAIAPLTHDKTVAEIFSAHVATMSAPANKGERICLFNTLTPTHQLDTLVCSGTTGNTLGADSFDTGIANLSSLLLAADVPNPVGTISADYGVFIDLASDDKRYSVLSVSGSVVTVRLTFTGGENDDGFYAQAPDLFPPNGVPLIDETFAVKIRGTALTLPTGKPDKAGIALTVQEYAQTFRNRRFWHVLPDKAAATLGGIEQQIEGYYMCAAYAGLIAGQPPQQSFTNFPLTGFTRVMGSNDTFSERQLNIMAAGGNWIVIQDTLQSPLVSRMALTTDMTSVETRTDSITKVVDFTAKIMRRGYRNFIGRFNVTQGFLDSLGHVGQGILTFLTEAGVLIGGSLNNIVQDEQSPDTVLVDATLDPPYPCNYIRLTLVI